METHFQYEKFGAETTCFPDLEEKNIMHAMVCNFKSHGIIQGYHDGTFKPNETITLAEGLKVIMPFEGLEWESTEVWHEGIMDAAEQHKIVPFEGENSMQLTRGHMAALVAQFMD